MGVSQTIHTIFSRKGGRARSRAWCEPGHRTVRYVARLVAVCVTGLTLALMALSGPANAGTGARWQTGLASGDGYLSVYEHWTNIFTERTGHKMTSSVYDDAGGPCGRNRVVAALGWTPDPVENHSSCGWSTGRQMNHSGNLGGTAYWQQTKYRYEDTNGNKTAYWYKP